VYHKKCLGCRREASLRWARRNKDRMREASRKWASANKDRMRELTRRWRAANKKRMKELVSRWANANRTKCREASRRWRAANTDRAREASRRWYAANKDLARDIHRRWARANAGRCAAKTIARRAAKYCRTPQWLTSFDTEAIRSLYTEAARLTRATGVKHEVDHVIPLRGQTVSGLHVPQNLRIITKAQNAAKRNRFDPQEEHRVIQFS